MKKFEDNDTVILLMTKKEATALRNAIVNINTELDVVIKTSNDTECITKTDAEICTDAQTNITPLRQILCDINPMSDNFRLYECNN